MKKILRGYIFVLFALITSTSFSQEICNNGIDDDTDGLIDLNDTTDCSCSGISGGGGGPIPSLIPNPSFETTNCCPSSYSELNCASSWVQASDATSDYFNCGFNFGAATSLGISAPDGTGYVGAIVSPGYVEYIGSCLSSPLIAGTSYTFQMQIAASPIDGFGDPCNGGNIFFSPLDLTYFGSTNCSNLPYSGYDCPTTTSGWQVLGSTTYTPSSTWGVVTVTFTPSVNINAIIFGASCTIPADYTNTCYPYFYFDDLLLNNSGYFNGMQIAADGGLCSNNLILTASLDTTGGTWQWYDEGVAILNETDSVLNVSNNGSGPGNYSAVYSIGSECIGSAYTVVNPILPIASFTATENCPGILTNFTNTSTIPSGSITNYDWNFDDLGISTLEDPNHLYAGSGAYQVSLIVTSDQGCKDTLTQNVDVFAVPIANFQYSLSCEGEITNFTNGTTLPSPYFIDSYLWIFNGTDTSTLSNPSYLFGEAGTYPVTLIVTSNEGCIDTVSSTVIICNDLILPNVFSPNNDNENELFLINGLIGSNNRLVIYNRWGQIIYENNDYQNNWDANGVSDGTYYYLFYSNTDQIYSGYVTVLR